MAGFPGYDRPAPPLPVTHVGGETLPEYPRVDHAYTLEGSGEKVEQVKYYIVTFAGVEPSPEEEDAVVEPLDGNCIALELGRGLANLGVDLIFSLVYVSPILLRPEMMAIHEAWADMSGSDKRTLALLSPRLSMCIQNLVEHGNPEDSQRPPQTVGEDSAPDQPEDCEHDDEEDDGSLWDDDPSRGC